MLATCSLLVLALTQCAVCQQDLFTDQAFDQATEYDVPPARIVAFTPKGLRFVIAHSEGMDLVGLIANINSPLAASASSGHIKREVKRQNNNRWVINESERVLNVGDVINYKLAVRRWGRTYFSGLKSFRVRTLVTLQSAQSEGIIWPGTELSANPQYPQSTQKPIVIPSKPGAARPPPRPPAPVNNKPTSPARPPTKPQVAPQLNKPCQASVTVVRGKPACKGELVFEDHFDSLNLSSWQYNVRIADTPDYEFVIYDRRAENSYVEDGYLQLKPSLTEQVYGKPFVSSGHLQLEDCTASNSEECSHQANFGFIMPAVISSRLRSAPYFTFKFGRVEVRAKMAAGDWLTSGIFLQPLRNTYGPRYDSGQIRLAMSRGNLDLQCDDTEAGISQVEAGVMLTAGEEALRRDMGSRELARGWDKEFHVYRLDWTPDKLTFLVDGRVVTTISPPAEGFFSLADFEDTDVNPWRSGTKMAPFDKEFMLVLSLGAGGIHDFADNCVNNGHAKPWRNGQPKAKLNFYKDQGSWAPTWRSPLQVDYVKVWAI